MEIGLPPAPSALVWRRNDIRPITHDLNETLVRSPGDTERCLEANDKGA